MLAPLREKPVTEQITGRGTVTVRSNARPNIGRHEARVTMTSLQLIYFNAGGGHRAAAQALAAVIGEQRRPWQATCVNLVQMLDPAARFHRLTGMAPEDLYNRRLARGWTLGMAQELKLLQRMIQLGHEAMVRRMQRHWLDSKPDLVVSLVPNFNRALYESLSTALPGVPFVTVLTDMADHPPGFWIEPGQVQDFVCGTDRAVQQALALGHHPARVHRSSGMIIRPDFYQPLALDRRTERLHLGLDPERTTGVVMFGGEGSMAMVTIARQLAEVQLVLMCGHNRELAQRLRALPATAPRAVVEFTPQVRRHLMVGDFFIGKPGPGSLSEAVQQGLPVVTVRNAWTMPQERFNTDWVQQQGLGVVSSTMRNIRPAVAEVLERLDEFRANVGRIDNRAVFEVPDILAGILDRHAVPPALRVTPAAAVAAH
jgi:UDP-N-acetylglucosamine:LPS N-acetylglucosamine transferase